MNAFSGLVVLTAVAMVGITGAPAWASSGEEPSGGRPASRQAPAGSIVSYVRDQAGRPLPGAVVSAVGRRIVTSVTDERGRCEFDALPAGDYLVRVHREGFVPATSLLVLGGQGASSTWSFVLKRQPERAVTASEVRRSSAVLTASIVPTPSVSAAEPEPAGADDETSHDHGEVAWRLKHLKRHILKDATTRIVFEEGTDPQAFDEAVARMFATRRSGPAQVVASLFSEFPLAGQVNLLTTGAFDSPEQLVSAGSLARGVAMVSLGAAAGRSGDWAVHGAMTQGDVASWMVSGSYLSRAPATHVYDVGMSYSVQRYDGANPVALAAVADGSRYAGVVYAFDSWTLNERVSVQYGARYATYGYIEESLFSPRLRLRVTPVDGLRLSVGASRRALAPGAEEFVPSMALGTWLPPERTFSPITGGGQFVPARTEHFDFSAERDLNASTVLGVRAFYQQSTDQIATLFGADAGERPAANLGHYYVGTAGDVDASGWTISLRRVIARRVRGSIDYTVATARWHETALSRELSARVPNLARTGVERLHDVTTSIETELPVTETRVFALYRINTGYASAGADGIEPSVDARFDVQITQSLPFMNFANAQWEMLLGVRNLFRDIVDEGSIYDELLVVRPPKRVVGGLTLRF
ncbi:MAG TPA: TonB-dependent receptor [Vicinamibacterales bacterium]